MAPPDHAASLWTRPALPTSEAARPRVTREAIVAAALELADAEGLQAVSIRRVAAKLGTRPMGLYSHIERKDDLIDLMLDAIAGEVLLDEVPGDWREALRAIATRTREGAHRHPWIAEAAGERAMIGPNGIRHVEQSLAALAGLRLDRAGKRAVLTAVDAYTFGHVMTELARRSLRETAGLDAKGWSDAAAPYLEQLVATGEFPQTQAFGVESLLADQEDDDATFATGLEWLLDGIAASL